jgi:hypothetical protein
MVGVSGASKLWVALELCSRRKPNHACLRFYSPRKQNLVRFEDTSANLTNVRAGIRGRPADSILHVFCTRILLKVRRIEGPNTREDAFYRNKAKSNGLVTKGVDKIRQK